MHTHNGKPTFGHPCMMKAAFVDQVFVKCILCVYVYDMYIYVKCVHAPRFINDETEDGIITQLVQGPNTGGLATNPVLCL